MFTQQAQLLANQYGRVPGAPVAGMMQTFANCAQPLTTRGPVIMNGAAASRPPRGGVITGPGNSGGVGNGGPPTGDPLTDYYNNTIQVNFNEYPGDTWNNNFFVRNRDNNFYAGDNTFWGGDTFYGDNYLSSVNLDNSQYFNNDILNNYNFFDSSYNNVVNNLLNQNVSNWYSQQFADQSYNDFSTHLNTTTNQYTQQVNNFEGDTYFDNTVTTNNTYNNNVTNAGEVINEGDVIHNGGVFIDAAKTYITNNDTLNQTLNLTEYVAFIVQKIFQEGNVVLGPIQIDARKIINNLREILDVDVEYERATGAVLDPDTCLIAVQTAPAKAKVVKRRARR